MSWDESNFGVDDGINCDCGGKTFRTDSQNSLFSYQCEECGANFQVEYDNDYDYDYDDIYL